MSRRALIYAKVLCDLSRFSTPTAPDAHSRSRVCGEVRSAFSLKIGPSLETFLKVSQAQTTRLGAVLGVLNFDWSYDFSQPPIVRDSLRIIVLEIFCVRPMYTT